MEKVYGRISLDELKQLKTELFSAILRKDLIDRILEIPDNATNGDVIKALFPNIESRLDEKTGIMLVKWVDGTTKTFKESWWNAPYKGGK